MKKPLDLHLDSSSVFTSLFPFFFTWTKGILDWESLEAQQMNINANQFILLFYTALYRSDYLLDF